MVYFERTMGEGDERMSWLHSKARAYFFLIVFLISCSDAFLNFAVMKRRYVKHISQQTHRSATTQVTRSPALNGTNNVTLIPRTELGIRTVGVDYGTARTGVAVTTGYSPRPLAILDSTNTTELSRNIVSIVKTEKADQVIVGMPFLMNGTETEQAQVVREFSSFLATNLYSEVGPKVSMWYWDERCSSKEAEARKLSSNPNADTIGTLDADAACIILEHFYYAKGVGAEIVEIQNLDDAKKLFALQKRKKSEERIAFEERRASGLNARKEAMARAVELESQMKREGTLTIKTKKKKRKKRKR